ncbi:unnamed protein product, partial [Vitis vinifera]
MQTKTYKGHPITLSKNPSPSSTWNSEAPLPNSQVKKVINGVVSTLPPIHLDLTINSQFLCHIATQQGEKEEREICSLHFPKILFVPRDRQNRLRPNSFELHKVEALRVMTGGFGTYPCLGYKRKIIEIFNPALLQS